ncbi:MAG: type II toxin-antitoxin system RelE/ParE family toxin [Nitrospirae bacterium]|nr:type II toxin-antitoxin system RelE/ParE family toxin [Nitrospirota bacterium]
MKSLIFLPEAKEEMNEAARYYEAQASGLGVDYLSEVERAVTSISESPELWPKLVGELRRRLVRRFPFGILYYIESKEIIIVAVAHLRRRPGYWKNRIGF